jgi:hypothetical protein
VTRPCGDAEVRHEGLTVVLPSADATRDPRQPVWQERKPQGRHLASVEGVERQITNAN